MRYEKNRSIIINLGFKEAIVSLKKTFKTLNDSSTCYVIFRNEYYKNGNVRHDFFDIIKKASEIGFDYVNTIVTSTEKKYIQGFTDNTLYIVWLAKNIKLMDFEKDNIREKHIWKDVEWGKRKKNYNPLGKDPGNVWIPTLDNGKGKITKHIFMDIKSVVSRIIDTIPSETHIDIFTVESLVSENSYIKQHIFPRKVENKLENYIYDENKKLIKRNKSKMENTARIIFDSSEVMDKVTDKSVNVIITSPPYWNLKDYFKEGQIGQESYDAYLYRLSNVWREAFRVLTDDGVLWININIRTSKGKPILIPFDIVKECKNIGFNYKGIIIWHKSSGIPTNAKNLVDRHEYVLLFTKKQSKKNISGMNKFSDYCNDDINQGSFWNINRRAGSIGRKHKHPAIFPIELVNRLISISSIEQDTILDPFLGSGTSLISAINLNRNFIGYEFNEGFEELIKSRINKEVVKDFKISIENK